MNMSDIMKYHEWYDVLVDFYALFYHGIYVFMFMMFVYMSVHMWVMSFYE